MYSVGYRYFYFTLRQWCIVHVPVRHTISNSLIPRQAGVIPMPTGSHYQAKAFCSATLSGRRQPQNPCPSTLYQSDHLYMVAVWKPVQGITKYKRSLISSNWGTDIVNLRIVSYRINMQVAQIVEKSIGWSGDVWVSSPICFAQFRAIFPVRNFRVVHRARTERKFILFWYFLYSVSLVVLAIWRTAWFVITVWYNLLSNRWKISCSSTSVEYTQMERKSEKNTHKTSWFKNNELVFMAGFELASSGSKSNPPIIQVMFKLPFDVNCRTGMYCTWWQPAPKYRYVLQ